MNVLQADEVTTPKHFKTSVSPLFWPNTDITSTRMTPDLSYENLAF